MLTAKQHDLLCFIDERLRATGVSPSFEEMKDALELKSKSGVHRLISALEERSFIRRLPNRARALEVTRMPDRGNGRGDGLGEAARGESARGDNVIALPKPVAPAPRPANDVIDVPLHGRIAAGAPIEAFEGHSALPVPAALLGPGEHFALEVSGDSMVEAGILDGDYALIRRADSASEGQIVVALIDDSEATLKFFRREGAMIRLDPANRAHDPQRYRPDRVRVQGRLAGLLRRYH